MKVLIFVTATLLSISAQAEKFFCELHYNLDLIADSVVDSKTNEKVLILKNEFATAYINQKSLHDFELELYLPEQQMRLYSRANLSVEDAQISVSTWSRDSMIDLICKR